MPQPGGIYPDFRDDYPIALAHHARMAMMLLIFTDIPGDWIYIHELTTCSPPRLEKFSIIPEGVLMV